MSVEICEICDERPASSVFMGAFACNECRREIVGWPEKEEADERVALAGMDRNEGWLKQPEREEQGVETKTMELRCASCGEELARKTLYTGPLTQEYWDEKHRQVVLLHVLQERQRQDEKWGEQNHDDAYWNLILGEERGEAEKAMLEGDEEAVERELTEMVAVGFAWLEALRRRRRARAKAEART